MQRLLTATVFLFAFNLYTYNVHAQSSVEESFEGLTEIKENLLHLNQESSAIFQDQESNTFYIDFEKLNYNLSNLVVKNSSGKELFRDDVWDLPVDTIYELNMDQFGIGEFEIEVCSFTRSIRKKVMIN